MTVENVNLEDSLEDLDLEDKLSGITADLLGYKKNSNFIESLFSKEAGKWIEIEVLCNGLKEIENELEELRESFQGKLLVTWLYYPTYGELDCMIVFFAEDLHWSNIALYNKQLFFRKLEQTRKST